MLTVVAPNFHCQELREGTIKMCLFKPYYHLQYCSRGHATLVWDREEHQKKAESNAKPDYCSKNSDNLFTSYRHEVNSLLCSTPLGEHAVGKH